MGTSFRTAAAADVKSAEMYFDNNSTAQVIETANTPIMLRNMTVGELTGWTYHQGTTAGITIFADYSGTVAGTVLVTSAAHGLVTGDIISIRGTTSYNGVFAITKVSDSTFYITDTWVADDGASDWDQGDYLLAGVSSAGDYSMVFNVSGTPGGAGVTVKMQAVINSTLCTKCIGNRKFANNDLGNLVSASTLVIAVGDRLALVVESDSTANMLFKYGNISIHRI